MLASVQTAEARIVYTPANLTIPVNGGLIQLDLNHDGIADFAFSSVSYSTHGFGDFFLKIEPDQNSNEIADQVSKGHMCAAALAKGVQVGPKSRFHQDPANGLYMWFFARGGTQTRTTSFGPWRGLRGQRYLGLKFVVNGKTHYGWARVKFEQNATTVTGYAYETIPNKFIIAGKTKGPDEMWTEEADAALIMPTRETAGLGLLALGAPGLSTWRRESVVATP
jgi:hypothetical protein